MLQPTQQGQANQPYHGIHLVASCHAFLQTHISTDGCAADAANLNYCDAGSPVSGSLAAVLKGESAVASFGAWLAEKVCTNEAFGSLMADSLAKVVGFIAKFTADIQISLSRELSRNSL